MRQSLRISSDLEVHFEEGGRAWFRSRSGRQLAAVEQELSGWQDFVERWLQTVEEPKPTRLSPEEKQLLTGTEACVKSLRKLGLSNSVIEEIIRGFTNSPGFQLNGLSREQVQAIVERVVSAL